MTLTETIEQLREAQKKNRGKHTDKCKEQKREYRAYSSFLHECDCIEEQLNDLRKATQKMLDYVDGADVLKKAQPLIKELMEAFK